MQSWAAGATREKAQRPRRRAQPQSATLALGAVQPSIVSGPTALAQPVARTNIHKNDDLTVATARLALATARQVRSLAATVVKTVSIPDTTLWGPQLRELASRERNYGDNELAYMWAQLLIILLEASQENLPADALAHLLEHSRQSKTPETLREVILECNLSRAWSGDSTTLKYALSSDFHATGAALSRVLVAGGSRLRFGPAPRGPFERQTSAALDARLGK